eukprot:800903-Pyramimonas_sp.AAC.1
MERLRSRAEADFPEREPITLDQLEAALRTTPNSSGQGSDMWKVQHLKALAPQAKEELADLLTR